MGAPAGMFDPLTMPKKGMPGMPMPGMEPGIGGTPPVPMRVGLGYDNQYGTRLSVEGDPLRRDVGIEAQFPVGGHRSGLQLSAQGGWNPESGVNASLRFGKVNRAVPENAAVNAILQRHLENARNMGAPVTPELQSELGNAAYLEADDLVNGVGVPGREKYGFGLTLNGRAAGVPNAVVGAGMPGMPPGVGGEMRRGLAIQY